MLRFGIWSLEDFVGDINERLLAYTVSPVRNAPNARIVSDFWTDDKTQQLPYQRGFLLAFVWDKRLRDAGKGGLDTVMFAARDAFVAAGTKPNAAENFLASYARVSGTDLAPDIARFVTAGETIVLPDDLFGACASVRTTELALYDPGFDREKSAQTGLIAGVEMDGPAYAAGLRDGMKRIKRIGGKEGDSRVPLGYEIVDRDGKDHVVTWLPAGKDHLALPQVMLTPGLTSAQRVACTRAMSGA